MGVWSIGHGRFHVFRFVIIFTEYNTFYEYNIITIIYTAISAAIDLHKSYIISTPVLARNNAVQSIASIVSY
jgi:hypothetical protein